jgi:hypothetical protein
MNARCSCGIPIPRSLARSHPLTPHLLSCSLTLFCCYPLVLLPCFAFLACSERDGGYYTSLPYLLSQVFCDLLPMRVLPPLLFGAICYFMIGLNPDPYRFVFCLVTLVLINVVVGVSACSCLLLRAPPFHSFSCPHLW